MLIELDVLFNFVIRAHSRHAPARVAVGPARADPRQARQVELPVGIRRKRLWQVPRPVPVPAADPVVRDGALLNISTIVGAARELIVGRGAVAVLVVAVIAVLVRPVPADRRVHRLAPRRADRALGAGRAGRAW